MCHFMYTMQTAIPTTPLKTKTLSSSPQAILERQLLESRLAVERQRALLKDTVGRMQSTTSISDKKKAFKTGLNLSKIPDQRTFTPYASLASKS
jgi:hypothetical protein